MALKVVVADDEPHIRHVIALKMQKHGFEVFAAADGEEALDLVLQEKPDLLITDYQMPVMSGLVWKSRWICRVARFVIAILLNSPGLRPPESRGWLSPGAGGSAVR